MEGKEAIIAKILDEAKGKAKDCIDSANQVVAEKTQSANDWVEQYLKEENASLDIECNEIVSRRKSVASLDVKKEILRAKQEIISNVFERIYQKLCSLDRKDYSDVVKKLLEEYAENDDEIILSKDNVISENDLKTLKIFVDKNLSIRKEKGNFLGGVFLCGKNSDKDLTFLSLVKENEEKYSVIISKKLFG